jgi:hypothetical protein
MHCFPGVSRADANKGPGISHAGWLARRSLYTGDCAFEGGLAMVGVDRRGLQLSMLRWTSPAVYMNVPSCLKRDVGLQKVCLQTAMTPPLPAGGFIAEQHMLANATTPPPPPRVTGAGTEF